MTAGCPEYKCLYVGLERGLEVWRLRALDARRKELYSTVTVEVVRVLRILLGFRDPV